MSLATLLGLDNIGDKSVQEAHAAINDGLEKAAPLLADVERRLGGIAHGLLDRFEVNITIRLKPIDKAELANPPQ